MKHYEVVISGKALDDMETIYHYIAETLLEPAIAAKQYDRIADAILSLEEMPERIKLMDDVNILLHDTLRFLWFPYVNPCDK